MKLLVFVSLLVLCGCTTTPGSTSAPTTTTETSTDAQVTGEQDKADIFEIEAMKTQDEEEEKEEASKSKRTIERNLGYGFNDAGANRLNRQSDAKLRNYYSQPSAQQQAHPYQHVRYYSNVRTAGPGDQGHRPYSAPLSSAASYGNAAAGNHVDSATPESVYFTKPSYQQVSAYRGSNNGAHVFPSPSNSHQAPLFSGPPAHAPTFYSGHSLASTHNPFATAPGHNIPNPFLGGVNYQGAAPILYQHPGSGGLALLQGPAGHFGPQILPVIILRVGGDAGNVFQHHQGAAASNSYLQGLQGLNLQTLLFPVQQYQTPQHAVFTPEEAGQVPQVVYQDVATSDASRTQYQAPQQKPSYATAPQKKPLTPTPAPSQTQKLRKNIVVLGEASAAQPDNLYSQYKYSYKDKA